MKDTIDTLTELVDRGLLISSSDFAVEKLPDGRSKVRLLKKLKAGPDCTQPVAVTFSGLTFCFGCYSAPPDDFTGAGGAFQSARLQSVSGVNGVPLSIAPVSPCFWQPTGAPALGDYVIRSWGSSATCSGGGFADTAFNPSGTASGGFSSFPQIKHTNGRWQIYLTAPGSVFIAFSGIAQGGGSSPVTVSNLFTGCDQLYINPTGDPDFDFSVPLYSLAYGGTATIQFTPL